MSTFLYIFLLHHEYAFVYVNAYSIFPKRQEIYKTYKSEYKYTLKKKKTPQKTNPPENNYSSGPCMHSNHSERIIKITPLNTFGLKPASYIYIETRDSKYFLQYFYYSTSVIKYHSPDPDSLSEVLRRSFRVVPLLLRFFDFSSVGPSLVRNYASRLGFPQL